MYVRFGCDFIDHLLKHAFLFLVKEIAFLDSFREHCRLGLQGLDVFPDVLIMLKRVVVLSLIELLRLKEQRMIKLDLAWIHNCHCC